MLASSKITQCRPNLREPILIRPHFTILLSRATMWPPSARNGLRFMRPLLLVTLVLCFAHDFVIGRATAIEVQCIEASKYKYLYQIFGGDSKKFAAYLQLDAGKLPNPEHCRAALISGGIEAPQAKDADKLLAATPCWARHWTGAA